MLSTFHKGEFMHARIKIGAGAIAAAAATIMLLPAAASADYAPSGHDVVGVGSDTLQALGDFVADGSYVADPGYNVNSPKYRFISIDATADANTRLAYGPQGANGLGTSTTEGCAPGLDKKVGTGTQTGFDTTTGNLPCTLNPTVVLRAGLSPEQRPNGSGAGYNILSATTTTAGAALGDGGWGTVNFARASAPKNGNNSNFDSIEVGTDDLAMLAASTGSNMPAAGLTTAQLTAIYNCTDTVWTQVGGSSSATIDPLIPQVGSGTRSVFLGDLGLANPGSCVQNVEENDPNAIADSQNAANAIEPMANTRLNLFNGISGTGGAANGGTANGYFDDPSCPFNPTISSYTSGTNGVQVAGTGNAPTQCQGTAATLVPAVKEYLSHGGAGGTSSAPYDDNRPLYIYFRHSDITSPTIWEPGGTLNWVRTMFYNPCTASITSLTILTGTAATNAGCSAGGFGDEVGPGGEPFFESPAGQQDIADAGVQPTYLYTSASP